ncbi:UNVERIFIED_CONTAM: hypothetical protein DV032_16030, partial [Lacticaseibacillus paracasei]|nr:hypothetical protein [Lacticaseibacillus paracasei]
LKVSVPKKFVFCRPQMKKKPHKFFFGCFFFEKIIFITNGFLFFWAFFFLVFFVFSFVVV